MTTRRAFRRLWNWIGYLGQVLLVGVPWYDAEDRWEPLEGQVRTALSPVVPPADFRQSLAENLALATQSRRSGLVVEDPRRIREGVILGISAGLAAATMGAIALVLYTRLSGAER